MRPSRRITSGLAAVLAVSALGFAVWVLVELGRHWPLPQYAMPWWVPAVAVLCVALIAWGGVLAMRRWQPLLPWLTALTTLLFVFAFIAMFSIGPLVLVVAVASLLARRRAGKRTRDGERASRVAPGLLLSVGLSVIGVLALLGGPIVECMQGGSSSYFPVWTWLGSGGAGGGGSGSASSDTDVHGGQVSIGATTYSYTCAGDRLVRFSSG